MKIKITINLFSKENHSDFVAVFSVPVTDGSYRAEHLLSTTSNATTYLATQSCLLPPDQDHCSLFNSALPSSKDTDFLFHSTLI